MATKARRTTNAARLAPATNFLPLNDARRERASKMFAEGKTTEQVAKNVRVSVPSARALRANWTRTNG